MRRKPIKIAFAHTYALRYLQSQGITITAKGKPPWNYKGKELAGKDDYEAVTRMKVGSEFAAQPKTIVLKSIAQVESLDLYLVKKRSGASRMPGQQWVYDLTPYMSIAGQVETLPKDHSVYYYPKSGVARVVGPYSSGRTVRIAGREAPRKEVTVGVMDYAAARFADIHNLQDTSEEHFVIDDAVLMIVDEPVGDRGKLLCIPRPEMGNMSHIGLFGQTGFGKTVLLHSIADNYYWKFGIRIAMMNDFKPETGEWCRAWSKVDANSGFFKPRTLLGERSLPLPMLYLHPSTNTMKRNVMVNEDQTGVVVSLPPEVVEDIPSNFKGQPDWVPQTPTWSRFKNFLEANPKVLNIKKWEDFDAAFTPECMEGKSGKPSYEKMHSVMKNIYSWNVLSTTSRVPHEWKVSFVDGEEYVGSPWNACLLAGVNPCLVTTDLKPKPYYADYLNFVSKDVYEAVGTPLFRRHGVRVLQCFDEVQTLQNNYSVIDEVMSVGRYNHNAVVYSTQDFLNVSDVMDTNTDYVFLFRSKGKQMVKMRADYGVDDSHKSMMKGLGKLECFAATTTKFVLYDCYGVREEKGGVFKGRVLPPLSRHTASR